MPNRTPVDVTFQLRCVAMILCCCPVLFSGCAVFDTDFAGIFEKKPEFQTPHQVIPLWTDTVLHQPGKKGQRGCGGRFMFYTASGKEGVRVDGTLTVYVWDDSRSSHQRKPDRKYVFTADHLQEHYSRSKVGDSYSFWIPWDEAGNDRVQLTVVARFVGRDGTDLTTPASKVILPGPVPMPEVPETAETDDDSGDLDMTANRVRQASWSDKRRDRVRPRRTLRSSEIEISPGFVKRNQQAAAESLSAVDLLSAVEPEESPKVDDTDAIPGPTPPEEANDETPPGQPESDTVSGKPSAQRAARSLQSRFQARRARVVQRFASAAETKPSLAVEP